MELLRKAHRSELVPLARCLGVDPGALPLDKLAAAVDRRLRRAGAHEIANAVKRKGDGPPYAEVLDGFGARHRMELPSDPEAAELAVLRWWLDRFWSQMDADTRSSVWTLMEGEAPPPADPSTALATIDSEDPHGYLVTRPGLKMLVVAPTPAAGCLTMWFLGKPRDDLLLPGILEVAKLRQSIRHRVTVGVVGSPSCGKDAAIKAIFGIDSGNVNPVAGSTKTVEISRLEQSTALFVVNTPGMGDVIEEVTEAAREVLDLIDVYVYVLNSQGGVQARELADYQGCVASGRPVMVVVNKIDTLRERDRERYLADARQKLGAAEGDFFAAAFDPLPQLHDGPIGLQEVRDWIATELTGLGKDRSELPW